MVYVTGMRVVQPDSFPPARGYSNGIVADAARTLYVGGQVGWESDGTFASVDLVPQFARALDNVLAVVAAAGSGPGDIASMTIYVTDVAAYRAAQRELRPVWRERMGDHYPAMALIAVTALVEAEAVVEIQAVALVHEGAS